MFVSCWPKQWEIRTDAGVYSLVTNQPHQQLIIRHILGGKGEEGTRHCGINWAEVSQGVKASQLRFGSIWHHQSAAEMRSEPIGADQPVSASATQIGSSTDMILNDEGINCYLLYPNPIFRVYWAHTVRARPYSKHVSKTHLSLTNTCEVDTLTKHTLR